VIICIFLINVVFSGCIYEEKKSKELEEESLSEIQLDQPSILPDWKDGDYHDYYDTTKLLNDFNEKYPDLVYVFSIGKSVLGKNIWSIRITNERNNQIKLSCLIDGCIHGCEWESGEACLYLAEYLIINFNHNSTIKQILNSTEIYILPQVNPDGRQEDYRFNENGIDLNRNFDVDFGRFRGGCIPLGKLFGKIKIPYIKLPSLHPHKGYYLNCGRRAFSESETQAIRDLAIELDDYHYFSFYLNCHTAAHNIISPWMAFKSPFEMTKNEKRVYDFVKNWIEENTEYEKTEMVYSGSGTAMDWIFKEFRIPSFTFEILSNDYEPAISGGRHDNLVHWMKTTIPVFLYFLVNINNLRQWRNPDIQPPLPEGVPPEPL
jgi:hypothetical protein